MKKITYFCQVGVVGLQTQDKLLLRDYLKKNAVNSIKEVLDQTDLSYLEGIIIQKDIPITLKLFFTENFNQLFENYEGIKNIDYLVIFLNLTNYELDTFYDIKQMIEIEELLIKNVNVILVGIEPENSYDDYLKTKLIEKAKELQVLYCYLITHTQEDFKDILEKIIEESILKFQFSKPDLFMRAKNYGRSLQE